MRTAIKVTDLNIQLSEILHSHLELMIRQCARLGLEFPDLDRTIELMHKEQALVDNIVSLVSPEVKRSHFSPEDGTEP